MNRNIALCFTALFLAACGGGKESQVKGKITEMLSFIELADPADFMDMYYDPRTIEEFKAQPQYKEVFINNKKETKEKLISYLREASNAEPVFHYDGQVAVFKTSRMERSIDLINLAIRKIL